MLDFFRTDIRAEESISEAFFIQFPKWRKVNKTVKV